MTDSSSARSSPPWMVWTGRVLSAIPVVLMVVSAAFKLSHAPNVVEGFGKMGISPALITPIGFIELLSVVLYVIPATAVLGAILIAGYLGGAIMTHLHAGQIPIAFTPFILGVFAWGGLFLREPRLRALLPTRRP